MKKIDQSELWHLYQSTVFLLSGALPELEQFAIVTAYHPLGRVTDAEKNHLLQQELIQQLNDSGCQHWPIIGCSPDLMYREPSLIIQVNKTHALVLAEKFKQNAIFWVEADQLWLTPCLMQGVCELWLGSFTQRLVLDKL